MPVLPTLDQLLKTLGQWSHFENREMNPLSREDVDENMFAPFATLDAIHTSYDKKSIIHHPVANALTVGNWEVPINRRISRKDNRLMK